MLKEINFKSLKSLMDRLNQEYNLGLTITEIEKNKSARLMVDSINIIQSNFNDIKHYLQGIEFGLIKCNVLKSEKDSVVLSYFKNKVGKSINVKVQKLAKDSYYSQEIRNFNIKILAIEGNDIIYQADTFNITTSLRVAGTNISTPILRYSLDKQQTMEDIQKTIIPRMFEVSDTCIKNELINQKCKKIINFINPDLICNITEKDLERCGWSNPDLVTVNVKIDFKL